LVARGGDFTVSGDCDDLKKFAEDLGKKYLVKVRGVLGPDRRDLKEITLLNRVINWNEDSIDIEADPRHAELVIRELGLCDDSKGSTTPGCKIKDDEEPYMLDKVMTTKYRSITARLNYMVSDRADLQYSVKELCRDMSAPTTVSLQKLKKVGRYLKVKPRLKIRFDFQDATKHIDIFTDSDWAGCHRTRKSTNGGCAMRGKHTIKTWSSTQGIIALSSGEAEYYGITKAGVVGLGLRSLCSDFDLKQDLIIHTDSTAAKGISKRTGTGKIKHLDIQYLWIQQHIAMKNFRLAKVPGRRNPADLMTKYLDESTILKHVAAMNMKFESGRSSIAPGIIAFCGPMLDSTGHGEVSGHTDIDWHGSHEL
jgi:hypothetical protein